MTTILILFILIGLGLYGVKEYYQVKIGGKPHRTPGNIINAIAQTLQPPADEYQARGGRLLHLGSAYGDLVLGLARQLPLWQIDGVEQNPTPWILSNLRSVGKSFTN